MRGLEQSADAPRIRPDLPSGDRVVVQHLESSVEPASRPSRSRISFGSVICPLLVFVFFEKGQAPFPRPSLNLG
jgi:hypothetical protein